MGCLVETIGDCTLYLGNCLEILPTLGPAVDTVITDPPYGIGKADWDDRFPIEWLEDAARIAPILAVMPGTWNLLKLPETIGSHIYKWTLSAHLINGMTKGGFGWGNWIPCVVYRKKIAKPQPEYVQSWCASFAEWCSRQNVSRRDLDRICGTSDMGGWYLGLLPYRCQIPAPHQWAKLKAALRTPPELEPIWIERESDYEPVTDCKRFAVGLNAMPDHPSPKPLNVTQWFVETIGGETILDPFMGSGTTGVACVNLGRKFIGIEIEPRYFDIACRRIEEVYKQPRLFAEPAPKLRQEVLL